MFTVFMAVSIFAQEAGNSITVNITGMKSDVGDVYVALFNDEDSFLKDSYKSLIGEVNSKESVVKFEDVPDGVYAISVFHDENDNKEMDTNFIGIPKEAMATSNGIINKYGPPKYKDATFTVKEDIIISIVVK